MVSTANLGGNVAGRAGLDYVSLLATGIELLQALSGSVWTDYNESDPGLTILEQLCYALTELSYRSDFPIADLLVDDLGRIEPERHALFEAARIFVCNPVTEGDYRKLFVDRVPGVRNAWLEPLKPEPTDGVNGLYRLRVYAPNADPCANRTELDPERILECIRDVYVSHRALCEDLAEPPLLLSGQPTFVGGRISIAPTVEPNQTLAAIQFAIGAFLAPELSRQSLATELVSGATPERIFTGPLLENGFISDDQLQPKLSSFGLRELAGIIAEVPGVVGVSALELWVGGAHYSDGAIVPIKIDEVLVYVPCCPGRDPFNEQCLKLFVGHVPACCECRRVDWMREQLWTAYRQPYPLALDYENLLAFPRGRRRPLASYTSIQDQFPVVYGINAYGLPNTATAARRGKAKQLKGYLLAFEQLLADFFSQLDRVRQLYSRDWELDQTYFWQSLLGRVPAVEALLAGGGGPGSSYERGLAALVAGSDPVTARRNELAAFLLSMHGQCLDSQNTLSGPCSDGSAPQKEQLVAKLELLDVLVDSTRDRGRGLAYRADLGCLTSPHLQPGMAIKSRIQLGMGVDPPISFKDHLDELGVDIAAPDAQPTFGRELHSRVWDLGDRVQPVMRPLGPVADDERGRERSRSRGQRLGSELQAADEDRSRETERLRGQTLGAEFVVVASDPDNYRCETQYPDSQVTLLCELPDGRWSFVAHYGDEAAAAAGAWQLSQVFAGIRRRTRQLFIVEHVLLRFALRDESSRPILQSEFEYSFTLTAVVASDTGQVGDHDFRRFSAEVIRSNAASHVVVELCFLDPHGLVEFERVYWPWRADLSRMDPKRLVISSRRMRDFLIAHRWLETDPC